MLTNDQIFKFYAMYSSLMLYVAKGVGLSPMDEHPQQYAARPVGERMMIRNMFLDKPSIVDAFIASAPLLEESDIAILRGWRDHMVVGRFVVAGYFRGDAIFISADGNSAYRVAPLFTPFEEIFGDAEKLPVLTDGVLLPFEDYIVGDGLYSTQSFEFPPELKGVVHETLADFAMREAVTLQLPRNYEFRAQTAPKPARNRRRK